MPTQVAKGPYKSEYIFKLLIFMLFLAFLLPEAFNHRYSIGTLQIFGEVVYLADIVSIIFVSFGFLVIMYNGIIRSYFLIPVLLFSSWMLLMAAISLGQNPVFEIIRDLRSLIPFLMIIVILQLLGDNHQKAMFVRCAMLVLVVPSIIIAAFAQVYKIVYPTATTFSPVIPGRFHYVNSDIGLLLLIGCSLSWLLLSGSKWARAAVVITSGFSALIIINAGGLMVPMKIALVYFMSLITAIYYKKIGFIKTLLYPIIIICLGTILFSPNIILNRVNEILGEVTSLQGLYQHNKVRFTQMWYGIIEISKKPLIGHGLGTTYHSQVSTFRRSIGDPLTRPADSFFLTLASNTGLIGLLLFGWIQIRYIRILFSLVKDEYRNRITPIEINFVYASVFIFPSIFVFGNLFSKGFWYHRVSILQVAVLIAASECLLGVIKNRVKQ